MKRKRKLAKQPAKLYLWIPCKPADKRGLEPIHVSFLNRKGERASRWECPHCGLRHMRRKPCLMHMGLVMNVPHCCNVLQELDEERRVKPDELATL